MVYWLRFGIDDIYFAIKGMFKMQRGKKTKNKIGLPCSAYESVTNMQL